METHSCRTTANKPWDIKRVRWSKRTWTGPVETAALFGNFPFLFSVSLFAEPSRRKPHQIPRSQRSDSQFSLSIGKQNPPIYHSLCLGTSEPVCLAAFGCVFVLLYRTGVNVFGCTVLSQPEGSGMKRTRRRWAELKATSVWKVKYSLFEKKGGGNQRAQPLGSSLQYSAGLLILEGVFWSWDAHQ